LKFLRVALCAAALLAAGSTFIADPISRAAPAGGGPIPVVETDPLDPFRGLGAWVDMYDQGPWDYPRAAVRRMAERGVDTLYLETANYRKPVKHPMYRPPAVAEMLEEAHLHGMDVVAWYVPAFDNLKKDLHRATTALDFATETGQSFDAFALDIEATVVRDIALRNERARTLSRRIRDYVGEAYTLGAIVPEAGALYWPDFPYPAMSKRYDLFLPMAYFSYRTSGASGVYEFVSHNISEIRRQTGEPDTPVHLIGGIAEDSTAAEVEAMVQATEDKPTLGASLYDFPTTSAGQWRELSEVAP
jgi:hypothetical protein